MSVTNAELAWPPMTTALLIFPHQLFAAHPGLAKHPRRIVLVEDPLFFGDAQYPMRFHKQKLWLHRASMARYYHGLSNDGWNVEIVGYEAGETTLANLVGRLAQDGVKSVIACDPVDFSLGKRLKAQTARAGTTLELIPSPMFLNSRIENETWRARQKRWFMAEFYKFQRRRFDILMDDDSPTGGKWSFDEANRKKVPKALLGDIPALKSLDPDDIDEAARTSINEQFAAPSWLVGQ